MRFPASKLRCCSGGKGLWEVTWKRSSLCRAHFELVGPEVEANKVEAGCYKMLQVPRSSSAVMSQRGPFMVPGALPVSPGWLLVPASTFLPSASHHHLCHTNRFLVEIEMGQVQVLLLVNLKLWG